MYYNHRRKILYLRKLQNKIYSREKFKLQFKKVVSIIKCTNNKEKYFDYNKALKMKGSLLKSKIKLTENRKLYEWNAFMNAA